MEITSKIRARVEEICRREGADPTRMLKLVADSADPADLAARAAELSRLVETQAAEKRAAEAEAARRRAARKRAARFCQTASWEDKLAYARLLSILANDLGLTFDESQVRAAFGVGMTGEVHGQKPEAARLLAKIEGA